MIKISKSKTKVNLIVDGKKYPAMDIKILNWLVNNGSSSAFEIMAGIGATYIQYVNQRLKMMIEISQIIYKPEFGKFAVLPEFKKEIEDALNEFKGMK